MIPRDILRKLPDTLAAELTGRPATPITTGMSGADVFRLRTKPLRFLKVAEADAAGALRAEIVRTEWLASRGISVAPILRTHVDGPTAAMLTQALPGTPADRSNRPAT